MKRACKDCEFFGEEGGGFGECRYDAPSGNSGYYGKWASVKRDAWCGRFSSKYSTATAVIVGEPHIV